MKKILFILLLVTTLVAGCGSSDMDPLEEDKIGESVENVEEVLSVENKKNIFIIAFQDGTGKYLGETDQDVVGVMELIEDYEQVENDYDHRTADNACRYPYITEELKERIETGRWEQNIRDGKICMRWEDYDMDYIKFNDSITEAESEYLTYFTTIECGMMEESGFKDGATYVAPVKITAKKVDGEWKIDNYLFTDKNAKIVR